ncbi:Thylakoid lumenal 16.5 kDa protein [Zostera marina]|uniref:Thylakoid lumenal 16.5 kDa protein n=1 Tax=Zostera marina TaxID=29655 RepID=A0A0K9NR54_ZOSMR|nr:Thylakoid lumenal 16.5 kDa protein [Zostera marina]
MACSSSFLLPLASFSAGSGHSLPAGSGGGKSTGPVVVSCVSRREGVVSSVVAGVCWGLIGAPRSSTASILEADDDLELLERVKKDKKKRIERQELINSSAKETEYLQEVVYKLDKVGQAIEKNDFTAANSILGQDSNAKWIKNINVAFTKLSSNEEEKSEADLFKFSLASLITSVGDRDIESTKLAFVSSATCLQNWATATGLIEQLKGI